MNFQLDSEGAEVQKVQKCVNLVDLVKSFQMTPELFLSRDGELRDIEEEFSDY